MDLPNDSIGISDILGWRECGRKMSFQMKRWGPDGEPPEATNETNVYGSAIHEVFRLIEAEQMSPNDAIQAAFDMYGQHLWPHDLVRMQGDVETYLDRDPLGVRPIAVELNIRVPLIEVDGQMIYFRGQIDRLYERLNEPGRFLHRDYKSSAWPKTQAEVDTDLQMWAYNWLIHEYWPECDDLMQTYDQLQAGEIDTRKSDAQRDQIKGWLQRQVVAILNDDPADGQGDGLLKPKFNEWCPWCPIKMDCEVPKQLSGFAQDRIDALSEIDGEENLDLSRIEAYVADLDDAATARKLLESYEKKVRELIKGLSPEDQDRLGYHSYQRRNTVYSSDALESIHELLGPEFFSLASLSSTKVKDYLAGDPRLDEILRLARKEPGAVIVTKNRKK